MNPWEKVREHLQTAISPQNYSTWLAPARFSHVEEDVLFVRVPNKTFRDFYGQNFGELFQQALKKLPLGIERIEFLDAVHAVVFALGKFGTTLRMLAPLAGNPRALAAQRAFQRFDFSQMAATLAHFYAAVKGVAPVRRHVLGDRVGVRGEHP